MINHLNTYNSCIGYSPLFTKIPNNAPVVLGQWSWIADPQLFHFYEILEKFSRLANYLQGHIIISATYCYYNYYTIMHSPLFIYFMCKNMFIHCFRQYYNKYNYNIIVIYRWCILSLIYAAVRQYGCALY